jgi:hypothetical protein
MLRELKTDYVDYGFIHCLDGASDWEDYQKNGVLEYLLNMKAQGVVRHIGLSTHTPSLAETVLDAGLAEQLMFSMITATANMQRAVQMRECGSTGDARRKGLGFPS